MFDFLLHAQMVGSRSKGVKLAARYLVWVSIAPVMLLTCARPSWRAFRITVLHPLLAVRAVWALLFSALLFAAPLSAQPTRVEAVQVELVARQAAAIPGRDLELGLLIQHDPHWHTYWRHPGDSGLPTRLEWRLPDGWRAGEIAWPAPARLLIGPLANYGFEGRVLLPVTLAVPPQVSPGVVELAVSAQWLVCKDVCIPGEAQLRLRLPVLAPGAAAPVLSAHSALFEQTRSRLPTAVLRVPATVAGRRLAFRLDQGALGRAEFFPYREGLIAGAAVQTLYRSGPGRFRLETELAEGATPDGVAALLRVGQPLGVLVLDEQVVELAAQPAEVAVVAPGTVGAQGQGGASAAASPDEVVFRATGVQLLAGGSGATGGASSGTGGRLLGAGDAGASASGLAGAVPADGAVTSLWLAALLGALGGLILNLMPCVFPVIGLKVMGFAGAGSGDARAAAQARHGALAFAAGVLTTFLVLASALLALRAAGESVGWGFQLQSPVFVAGMALLFMLIALNFAGLFEFGLRLTQLGAHEATLATRADQGGWRHLAGAFGSGALAVLVATPCTAPFMGSALGFTLGQPAAAVLVVFAAIAAGMALPYLVLGFAPRLLARLPRPGRWMESLRQFLAFPMLATAAWLAWVLGQQAGGDAVLGLMMAMVGVALAVWIYGRFVQPTVRPHRLTWALLAALVFVVSIWLAVSTAASDSAPSAPAGAARGSAASDADWLPWSEQRVAQAQAAGQPVFVDFTAAWCVSCQANKRLALEREAVRTAFARARVLRLRADWTHRDPAITEALARHGRNGVPLYLLYRPGQSRPEVLPELLTPGIVLDALGGPGRAL